MIVTYKQTALKLRILPSSTIKSTWPGQNDRLPNVFLVGECELKVDYGKQVNVS